MSSSSSAPARAPGRLEAALAHRAVGPALLVAVATGYLSTTQVVFWLSAPPEGGAGLWPAAGLSLAVLLLVPVRLWPWVLAGIAAAELGGDLARGNGLAVSLAWTLGNCLEPLVGALLLRRSGNPHGAMTPLPQLMRFLLLAVVVAPLVGAGIGGTATVLEFGGPVAEVWPAYYVGDALGVLIVAPALLARRHRTRRRRWEPAALVSGSLLVLVATFVPAEGWTTVTAVLLVPCFTWAAVRFGVRGVAWSSVVVTLIANTATAFGNGPFAAADVGGDSALVALQAYMAITVASALILASSVDDLSDRKEVERALHHQATHDHLTGLPNRAHLATVMDAAMQRAAVHGGHVGVLLCDLDLLKPVNDTHGHGAGDRYLVEVARRLAEVARDGESIARVGGDEFVLLVELADPADLDAVAHRLMASVQRPLTLTASTEVTPSLSIGAATSDATSTADSLLTHADQALYQAKRAGRNRVTHFDAPLRHRLREQQLIEEDLPGALVGGQIRCVHQPEVDLATGELFAFEALARWQHPTHGPVPPDRFVPVAETLGHAAALFDTVLAQTLASQTAWAEHLGFRPAVAVNLSAVQLGDRRLVEQVGAALARAGAAADTVWLEVTETASADPGALGVLNDLHDTGVHLAVDDFGTGWSSMARLADHPWDVIKLDRSFVARLGQDDRADHLVRAMIVMAHALGMRTVAEGVETTEQLDRVRGLGCDVAQGYLFSRPVAAEEAVRLVDGRGRWLGAARERVGRASVSGAVGQGS